MNESMNIHINKTKQEKGQVEDDEFSFLGLEAFVEYGGGTFQWKVRFMSLELWRMF